MSLDTDTSRRALDLIARLVAFDTESTRSNLPLIEAVEEYLRGLGVAFVRVPNATGDKASLFVTIGPNTDGGVVLSGHTDCVAVAGQNWTSDPFTLRRENGRLYGRGSCDMKGFGAIALAMIPEFQKAGLTKPVHLLLSYDEELTCLGPVDTIKRFGIDLPRPRACIVGEPTMMEVCDAHKAISTYVTRVHGVPAHSSKPQLGANAIAAACDLVSELYRLQAGYEAREPNPRFDPGYSTVHVGTIHGGTSRNILARECSFHWEFRALPGVRQSEPLDALNDYIARVALPKLQRFTKDAYIETEIECEVPGLAPEPGSVAETLALKLSKSNRTMAVAYATEAGRFQVEGVPTVVCGPGHIDQAHQPDEYLAESQVEACIDFMRGLARELS